MSITVPIRHQHELRLCLPIETVLDLLCDIERQFRHMPRLANITPVGDNCYGWETQPLGPPSAALRFQSVSRYQLDRAAGLISWQAEPGRGNASLSGRWLVSQHNDVVLARLELDCAIHTPYPGWMRLIVAPIVEQEFLLLVKGYVHALEKTLHA